MFEECKNSYSNANFLLILTIAHAHVQSIDNLYPEEV